MDFLMSAGAVEPMERAIDFSEAHDPQTEALLPDPVAPPEGGGEEGGAAPPPGPAEEPPVDNQLEDPRSSQAIRGRLQDFYNTYLNGSGPSCKDAICKLEMQRFVPSAPGSPSSSTPSLAELRRMVDTYDNIQTISAPPTLPPSAKNLRESKIQQLAESRRELERLRDGMAPPKPTPYEEVAGPPVNPVAPPMSMIGGPAPLGMLPMGGPPMPLMPGSHVGMLPPPPPPVPVPPPPGLLGAPPASASMLLSRSIPLSP